jgi:hypothetical protein
MDGDVLRFAQVAFVIASFATFAVALYVGTKFALRSLKKKEIQSSTIPQIDDSRFERLEQAVDSIAVEVERISEAQRFSAKLLSEQSSEKNKV